MRVSVLAFKNKKKSALNLDSPASMYADIRPRKSGPLYSQQRSLLDSYASAAEKESDVAFHLPTGAGKTLVALAIAEWRRLKFDERAVYLCPTKWLVNQVASAATDLYGIKVRAFTGKVADYNSAHKDEWSGNETVAITTYSGLFNNGPFFKNPHLIVLDDAHSAENYIAAFWSVSINRYKGEENLLFVALAALLKRVLSPTDHVKMTEAPKESWDKGWSDLISTPKMCSIHDELFSIIDEYCEGLDLRYAWRRIRERLRSCNLFVSADEILIRPLMPPTRTFEPFSAARQRLYMSATLGDGGDIERITGRKKIFRLPTPEGYERQAIGRRLFMFPKRSITDETALQELILEFMRRAKRSLVLTADEKTAAEYRALVKKELTFKAFSAKDLEESKSDFTSSVGAVAVIANRYDGIDFPGESCRLLLIDEFPRATNLQERVLINRMSAKDLLEDRIRTRIVQAVGRCTRSEEDYSLVVVLGEELARHLGEVEGRKYLHPELQAEIVVGRNESKEVLANDFLDNFHIFMNQQNNPEPWIEANGEILAMRDRLTESPLPGIDALSKSLPHEIEYLYALWSERYLDALEQCRRILPPLKESGLRGYDGLWTYLAGCAAWLATERGGAMLETVAEQYFSAAAKMLPSCRWLSEPQTLGTSVNAVGQADSRLMALVQRLEAKILHLGVQHDHRYAKEEKAILDGIFSDDGEKFEQGHERLGSLLGFESGKSWAKAAPDPYWIVDDTLCFVFEDYAGAKPESELDVAKARQAVTHPNWIRANVQLSNDALIVPVIVTPVSRAEPEAIPHLRTVYMWNLSSFRTWAMRALTMVRTLRNTFKGTGDLVWQATAAEAYRAARADPETLLADLIEHIAAEVLSPKGT